MMNLKEPTERSPELIESLLALWERSVRATHTFLTEEAIVQIRGFVPQALGGIPRLVIAEEDGKPLGFIGVDGDMIEMLFVDDSARGKGIGTTLLRHVCDTLGATRVDVNEQNPAAHGFYLHHGFRQVSRSPLDGQGNPYPILHLSRGA